MIPVTVLVETAAIHLNQVYTGLGELQRRGVITLRLRAGLRRQSWLSSHPVLKTVVGNGIRVWYDTCDDLTISRYDNLDDTDFYFKRSYCPDALASLPACQRRKVHPLGFNYPVVSGHDLMLQRAWILKSRPLLGLAVCSRIGALLPRVAVRFVPNLALGVRELQGWPDPSAAPPRFLFMARLWDPSTATTNDKAAEREVMNAMRAGIVRAMRSAFGPQFEGGLEPTPFAQRAFPDYVIRNGVETRRGAYLQTLRRIQVGIATQGLTGSPGWKIGEYIAFAKAIVTERLAIQVPGSFSENHNYLSFTSPAECVEQCLRLQNDPQSLWDMMMNNFRYYGSYVRPDSLVLNTLKVVTDLILCATLTHERPEGTTPHTQVAPAIIKAPSPSTVAKDIR